MPCEVESSTFFLLGAASLFAASATLADISYSQKITVEASGGMSMMASEMDVLTQLSGDKSRSESDMRMKSKLMNMASGGRSANIVRLDKELSWMALTIIFRSLTTITCSFLR